MQPIASGQLKEANAAPTIGPKRDVFFEVSTRNALFPLGTTGLRCYGLEFQQ